jgi:hypothetical protein
MTRIQTELPDALYRSARELAEQEGIPLERLVGLALAQAIGAWMSQRDLIQERAMRGNRDKYLAALNKAPDASPQAGDELP